MGWSEASLGFFLFCWVGGWCRPLRVPASASTTWASCLGVRAETPAPPGATPVLRGGRKSLACRPSPAVSLRPGPPSPAWLCPRLISVSRHHAVCPPPSWVLCSYEEFHPCSFWGFSFRKKPDSAGGHSQGFMASKGFCGFGSELTFVRILLGCEFHQH